MDFLIFIVLFILYIPLSIANFLLAWNIGYIKDLGVNLSKRSNRDLKNLLNRTLITKEGYKFGACDETISSVLGKNQMQGTLTRTGKVVITILHKCEKHHCLKSVHHPDYEERKQELMSKK